MTKNDLKAVVVIPARFQSTRFPGKPLATIARKPMIQHVYERASAARGIVEVIVATDDERIVGAVESFGGKVCMTSGAHRSGTERVAEVGRNLEVDVVVNLQGDEPMMDPGCIEAVVEPFRPDPGLMISTLKCLAEAAEISDPNVVKVVTDRQGNALYFSRSTIPHLRRQPPGEGEQAAVFKHVGIYAYRRAFLEILPDLPDCRLEAVEDLEQLRFLDNGYRIRVVPYPYHGVAVDTPEDLVRINGLAVQGRLPGGRGEQPAPRAGHGRSNMGGKESAWRPNSSL